MIYDNLADLARYKGLHRNIDQAIAYLQETDLSQLEPGRYDIASDAVFLLVQDNTLNRTPNDSFEYHKRYMDLQFLLSGNENFRYSRTAAAEVQTFNDVDDFGLISSQEAYDLELTPETFVMVYPGEYHQPSQIGRGDKHVRKCVVKILID